MLLYQRPNSICMQDSKNDVPHNLNSFDVLSKKYTNKCIKRFSTVVKRVFD